METEKCKRKKKELKKRQLYTLVRGVRGVAKNSQIDKEALEQSDMSLKWKAKV